MESSNPSKGDDPWLTSLLPSPKATSPPKFLHANVRASSVASSTAMMVARQRQADREIERYLHNSKFTDEAEREIERRFLSTPSRFWIGGSPMSTLPVRAPVVPPLGGFARVISFSRPSFEVFARRAARGRGRAQALSVRRVVKAIRPRLRPRACPVRRCRCRAP